MARCAVCILGEKEGIGIDSGGQIVGAIIALRGIKERELGKGKGLVRMAGEGHAGSKGIDGCRRIFFILPGKAGPVKQLLGRRTQAVAGEDVFGQLQVGLFGIKRTHAHRGRTSGEQQEDDHERTASAWP